ncbi:MAG: hypothetical protein PHU94_01865 [Bacilli bacterium]|nr:hypothetical protein [Bacilli bacterium]MDD4734269.1 hypothetical protein [Bacilli bacterium]
MENKKGYWIYSIVAIIIGMGLFAFIGYLIYDLILKLADKDFSNNTVIQALITLIITVFIGGYFSKWLEFKNNRKVELYKIRISISLRLIDLASDFYRNQSEEIKNILIFESAKVKLYFNDNALNCTNRFIESKKKDLIVNYNLLIDELKKSIK